MNRITMYALVVAGGITSCARPCRGGHDDLDPAVADEGAAGCTSHDDCGIGKVCEAGVCSFVEERQEERALSVVILSPSEASVEGGSQVAFQAVAQDSLDRLTDIVARWT